MAKIKLIKYKLEFNIPIYEDDITLIFTNNVNKVLKSYNKDAEVDGEAYAYCQELDSHMLLIFEIPFTLNTLVHEVSHCADKILLYKGMNLNEESAQETKAYLSGYIAEKIDEFYKSINDDGQD